MSKGRGFKIENHLSIDDLNKIINDAKVQNKIMKRAIFIKSLKQGATIKESSNLIDVARQTGSIWLKRYNDDGYDGLVPKYDGGRPGQLDDDQKEELKNTLSDKKSNYTISEVVKLIKKEYGVELSYNRVWTLVRKEFGLNYSKPLSIAHKKPKNGREKFKKKLKI